MVQIDRMSFGVIFIAEENKSENIERAAVIFLQAIRG